MKRPSKKEYYMNIARAISERSPCLKAKIGSIIVKNDAIISCGYNGPARGEPHCKVCVRMDKESGSEYTICPAIHSEENCIINAARQGTSTIGGTLYLYGPNGGPPCYRCNRALKNAGIKEVIYGKEKYKTLKL